MADDWVKIRTDIYRDPKVCIMADLLSKDGGPLSRYVAQMRGRDMCVTRNVTRNVTVGALVTVWGVTRHRGKRDGDDLVIRSATLNLIDDIADLPGMGEAMAAVGWAIQCEEGLVFPRFFAEFNTDPSVSAKQRNAERQKRYREKHNALRNVTRDVTVTSQSNVREEESREEKREREEPAAVALAHERAIIEQETPKPTSDRKPWHTWEPTEQINDPRVIEAVRRWETFHYVETHKRLNPEKVNAELKARRGEKWSVDKFVEAVDFTIRRSTNGGLSLLNPDNDFQKSKAATSSPPLKTGNPQLKVS